MAKPYKVLKKVNNFYKIKLLKTIKVYSVFSPNKLQKAANNLLFKQKNNPIADLN